MVHWVDIEGPGRVGILPRPRGGDWLEDEMRRLRSDGVDLLVSLLERSEVLELDLAHEPELARTAGIDFENVPIPDRGVPGQVTAFGALVDRLAERVAGGASVAIHCRAGIGRSSVLAASMLAARGVPVAEAFTLLSACRGIPVPDTPEQAAWTEMFVGSRRQR